MKDFKAIVSSGHGRPDWRSAEFNLRDLSKTIDSFAGSNVKSAALVVEYEEDMKKNDLSRAESMVGNGGRIRKLTARECFRLMNVDEANIDKIQAAGISETQQYKLAGNSIVVGVLAKIFRKLFIDTEPDGGQQLKLF